MDHKAMDRKEFLEGVGRACACSCVYALAAGLGPVNAEDNARPGEDGAKGAPAKKPRSQERLEFTEKWAVRFFKALDANLDEATRKKIMMANGRACLLAWQEETKQRPRTTPVTLESFTKRVKERGSSDYRIEGNIIHFQYTSAAETGLPSPENHCLCPMVESIPAGLSPTFCLCSLGYVKEMHEQMFRKPVEVELVSSVLRGDPRCRFKITVS